MTEQPDYHKKIRPNIEKTDKLIAKGYQSLEEQRQMLKEIIERNGWEYLLEQIRRVN